MAIQEWLTRLAEGSVVLKQDGQRTIGARMKEEDPMSARDHFALAAMVELMRDPNGFMHAWDIAPAAYAQAHYMMKSRKEESNESNSR